MTLRTTLTVAFALFAPVAARAQNGSSAGALELYPNFQAVGVRLSYVGDANRNATARLEWRPQGTPSWNEGMSMTRITSSRWAGSVLWLSPATGYEIRVVIEDRDGGASAQGSVSTRDDRALSPSGRTWWVATTGSDSAAGGSATPLRTLQHAADQAQSGDEIRVRPGIYYQTLDTPRPGSTAAPIFMTADAPGVVLDGSDPAYLDRSDWRSDGAGIWSVPYTPLSNRLVCVDSLERLYKQASLVALQGNANGVSQGFAVEGGRLYVKLEDLSAPTAHRIHVARSNVGLMIDSDAWRVTGFEVRYAQRERVRARHGCVGVRQRGTRPDSAGGDHRSSLARPRRETHRARPRFEAGPARIRCDHARSSSTAMPWPPPMQALAIPKRLPRLPSSISNV